MATVTSMALSVGDAAAAAAGVTDTEVLLNVLLSTFIMMGLGSGLQNLGVETKRMRSFFPLKWGVQILCQSKPNTPF